MKNLTRRQFLGSAAAMSSAIPFASAALPQGFNLQKAKNKKPMNVIFILSDDHRYDFMSFMGKPSFIETPNMDRMAAEGAHLENAFVTTSLCSPSRASILTGQYSHKHGVVDNNCVVPEGTVFFPQYLQKAGYQTAFIGKWHMGHSSDEPRPGFDRWVSFKGQGRYYDCPLNVDGKKVKAKKYITDELTDYALDWIKTRDKKPFFLYLSHKAVHGMFDPAKRHEGRYAKYTPEYPKSMADTEANYKDKPQWVKEQRNSWHGVDYMYHGAMDFDTCYRRYCEAILGLDDSIGRVLDCLKEQGLSDSTLVLYMGDNGFCWGEHGLIDKRNMYEASIRVPLLAYCPKLIKPGTKLKRMVQNIDIAPTILSAAGLSAPGYMDGRSFLPLLQGRETKWRDAIYYEYYWERNFMQTPTMHGVRTDRYKYIHYHGIWDIDELYDLQKDPEEMHNLIKAPEHQERIKKLKGQMFDWLENTGGMLIPLRRDRGLSFADRNPAKIKK